MKSIIITGGSRGIGAATSRLAAQHGYSVCVNYRENAGAADEIVKAIESDGKSAIAVKADVSVEADVIRLFETAEAELGPLSALVNNAAIVAPLVRVEDIDLERLNQLFSVNVIGAFLCAREAVKRMSTRNGGKGGGIVNVSSGAATLGSPGVYVDYAATKGAIDTLTVGLGREVANEGIRVNAVRPGFIHTEIHTAFGEPGRVDRLAPTIPMKRGGRPEEVARAILWLLSEDASYTTGTILDVAGGN
jgi:NAD(P)-dependent dehydrogenase (short-subunit alcohol dehydrogenase family)